MTRGQTHLPALAVALLVLTTVAGLGVAFAETAFAGAERSPEQRRVAVALSERLVSGAGPLATRPNVLNESAVAVLTADRLRDWYPVVGDRAVRVRLGDRTLVSAGSPAGGTTIRRLVLVGERQSRTYEPTFEGNNATTLPRRTGEVRLRIDPPARTAVETVRANGRVVLRNASGLRGTFTVDTSRFETTRLAFEANRTLSQGDVRVTYYPRETTKATLEVTVDA
jgi:hypothetical protein